MRSKRGHSIFSESFEGNASLLTTFSGPGSETEMGGCATGTKVAGRNPENIFQHILSFFLGRANYRRVSPRPLLIHVLLFLRLVYLPFCWRRVQRTSLHLRLAKNRAERDSSTLEAVLNARLEAEVALVVVPLP